MKKYFGKDRSDTLNRLLNVWLKDGPPVCFLDGFPGTGKTDLALELLDASERQGVWEHLVINTINDVSASVMNSFMELSSRLSHQGLREMESVLWEQKNPVLGHALEQALRRPVVIVLDEAQRLFMPNGLPLPEIEMMFSYLRNRPSLKGRLLLLTDRLVRQDKWSEWMPKHTLKELKPDEALKMLDSRLADVGATVEVVLERRMQALKTLHYNPRAIEALVARLQTNTLDEIMDDHPGFWATEDAKIDPDFLQNLERDLLTETMRELNILDQRKLWRLSAHRHSFQREALEKLGGSADEAARLYTLLISRFFLNFHRGSLTLNPIVREISLSHLRNDAAECRQAHSAAADYYSRPFAAKQLIGAYGKLAETFAELRYHLVQAGKEEELTPISHRFTDYLKQEIKAETPVPLSGEDLDYRIGALTLLLGSSGAKALEYHLARCLQTRNRTGDIQQAVIHASRATGSGKQEAPWVLLANLKRQLDGDESALVVIRRGLEMLPDLKVAAPLYRLGAEILADDHKMPEALSMLDAAIKQVPTDKNLFSIYELKAELLCRAGKAAEALSVVREGIGKISQPFGKQRLQVWALQLCAGSGIGDLEDIARAELTNNDYSYVAALGMILASELSNDWAAVARSAKSARREFASDATLATHEALAYLARNDTESALHALTSTSNFSLTQGAPSAWLETMIHLRRGQPADAERSLQIYLERPVSRSLELNEQFLLRLWDEQEPSIRGHRLCFNLPVLPSALTGAFGSVHRLQFTGPVLNFGIKPVSTVKAHQLHAASVSIYVSYAWGEDRSLEGRRREEIVDSLCSAVRESGREIGRDKERMIAGDSIDRFAREIAKADRIIAVLSSKSLKSEYCMVRELFRAYTRCGFERADFQERVIAVTMEDAQLHLKNPIALAKEWGERALALKKELFEVDTTGVNNPFRWQSANDMANMATRLPDMLDAIGDTIMRQGFDQIVANEFKDVLDRLP